MRELLYKAKLKNKDRWIKGFYCCKKETTYCFTEDYEKFPVKTLHYIIRDEMTDWGLPNEFRLYEIDYETLCEFTGWLTAKNGQQIFENDIVEFIFYSGKTERYLVWWCQEMSMMEAISLKDIQFNGHDYWGGKPMIDYSTFCLMLQDPWGDIKEVKVIGNLFDNPELLKIERN